MRRLLAPALVALAALGAPPAASALRPIPNTSAAVHVWDDQLPDSMSAAQIRFVARHVDGTQKVSRQTFSPPLRYFVGEAAWTARIDSFMRYEARRLHGKLWFIPNAGSWIITRDRTDYAIPDGVMIEGFAEAGPHSFYAPRDWSLQMTRALGLVRRGKVLIAQSYLGASDLGARGFVLGSYLLIKGAHTFLNMDIGSEPQWFPEYAVDLGPALAAPPASLEALRRAGGIYVRRYSRGEVAVNPEDRSHVLNLPAGFRRVVPRGGGALGAGASTRGWRLRLLAVRRRVVLPAHSGLVLTSSAQRSRNRHPVPI